MKRTDRADRRRRSLTELKKRVAGLEKQVREGQKAERHYRALFEAANDAIFILEGARFVECNPKTLKIFGFARKKDLLGRTPWDLSPRKQPDGNSSKTKALKLIRKALAGKSQRFFWKHTRADGTLMDAEVSLVRLDLNHRPYIQAIVRDVTKWKKAEEALRLSEEMFSKAFRIAPFLMTLIDPVRRIRRLDVNKAFTKITGYSRREGLRMDSISQFIIDRGQLRQALKTLVRKGRIKDYPIRIRTKSGQERLLCYSGETFDVGGKIRAILAAEDITDREKAEREIKEYQENLRLLALRLSSVEQKEKRHVANFVHDQIGQKLALTKMKLGPLAESLKDSEAGKLMAEAGDLLEETIQDTRALTFDLSPPILYELGLEPSIEWLAEHVKDKFGLQIEFSDDKKSKPLQDDVRDVLFRAVRELLMNVVKHAKAKSAKIFVLRENGNIVIQIRDDGIGFDTAARRPVSLKSGGFGIFYIKERLHEFDGCLDIQSEAGRGTVATLKAPLLPKKRPPERKI